MSCTILSFFIYYYEPFQNRICSLRSTILVHSLGRKAYYNICPMKIPMMQLLYYFQSFPLSKCSDKREMAPLFYFIGVMAGHFTLFLFLKTSTFYFVHVDVLWTNLVEQRQLFYLSRFSCNILFLSVVGRYAAGQIECCSNDALCQFQRQSYDSDESLEGKCTSFHQWQLELTIYVSSTLEVFYPSSDSLYCWPPLLNLLVFYFVRIRVKIFKLRHFTCSRCVQQP